MDQQLLAGFGKIDYTPDFGVGLAGYGGDFNRRNTGIVMPVYITCIAAQQDGVTALVYTVDTCGFRREHQNQFRKAITAATGVPGSHIIFGATHGHNCPTMVPESEPTVAKTLEIMESACVEAAKAALEDLAPAQMFGAKPMLPGLNFTRHYRLPGGVRTTSNTGMKANAEKTGHLGPSDPTMVLVKFQREGKPDIILANWQAHPDSARAIGFDQIAPGWPGPFRDRLAKLSGCHVAFFQGASGNQVPDTLIPEQSHGMEWLTYGDHLARKAFAAFNQFVPVPADGIFATGCVLPTKIKHDDEDKLEICKQIMEVNKTEGRPAALVICRANGLTTPNHAAGIIMRSQMAQDGELELWALRIGQVAFAVNTCETFSDQGLFVKNYSPYEYTFMVTGNRSYLASMQAHDYCCYEAVGGSGYYARGTAEQMADTLVNLLCEIV